MNIKATLLIIKNREGSIVLKEKIISTIDKIKSMEPIRI